MIFFDFFNILIYDVGLYDDVIYIEISCIYFIKLSGKVKFLMEFKTFFRAIFHGSKKFQRK